MKREEANEMVKLLRKKYEDKLSPDKAPVGKSFWELYDLKTVTPKPEYLEIYNKVIHELEDMGLKFRSHQP